MRRTGRWFVLATCGLASIAAALGSAVAVTASGGGTSSGTQGAYLAADQGGSHGADQGRHFREHTLEVGCGRDSYHTIGAALSVAHPGDTVLVCPRTYTEDVTVAVPGLTLTGLGHPVIDAAGMDNGIVVTASGVTVQGFTVEKAIGEGILVEGTTASPVRDVIIRFNRVIANDQGNPTGAPITTSAYAECDASPAAPTIPGDCGEGIHITGVHDSTVAENTVVGNSGGILVSDDTGATYDNTIWGNLVQNNLLDCGVTVVGHALFVTQGAPGGVYDNRVVDNIITGNGLTGQGGGVLLASGVPGGAVYGNLVERNTIYGNGLSGVTLHSHIPGQNLNGNRIVGNRIGTNNLKGDPDFYPLVDPSHTGILVAVAAPGTVSITITDNQISNDTYGIWMTPGVTAVGTADNSFHNVTTPVFTA